MGTPFKASTLGRLAVVLIMAATAGACDTPGTSSKVASPSRLSTPSAVPPAGSTPAPVTSALGVLVGTTSTDMYTVSLVGIDGRVVASAPANRPVAVSCADAAAAIVPPPVSTSNARVYFMDDKGVVRFLGANGDAGTAAKVPAGTPARRSLFAVSPDDQRIAVIVLDFTSSGASTRLYIEDLNGGGNHLELFSQTGAFTLWPTGWHGINNLVVAKVGACSQGGGPFSSAPQEFHVVDPANAIRRFTIGGPTCVIVGPPSPAGAICENQSNYQIATIYDWTGVQIGGFPIGDATPALLSPNGKLVAVLGDATRARTAIFPSSVVVNLYACGWIDDNHILSGGDTQHPAGVGDVASGKVVQVAATGDCAGRIPGGL
jgi:hypothetical protein